MENTLYYAEFRKVPLGLKQQARRHLRQNRRGELRIIRRCTYFRLCGAPHRRKNWLFAGSPAGGERAAVLYSLVESCRRVQVEPFAYLRDVISRVATHPMSRIGELTPRGWKAASLAEFDQD